MNLLRVIISIAFFTSGIYLSIEVIAGTYELIFLLYSLRYSRSICRATYRDFIVDLPPIGANPQIGWR